MSDASGIKILAICGSLRKGSYNMAALRTAIAQKPPNMTVDVADISQIPLYNEDVRQQGFPPSVETLRRQIAAADALLFACPEYNYSMTGVLKNAIDWASRPPDQPFAGKPCAIIGAAAGMAGSARAQYDLRRSCVFLDMQAQHLLVECDRAIHIRDPQYDVVEPLDPHGRLGGGGGAVDGSHIIRHSSAPCPISRGPDSNNASWPRRHCDCDRAARFCARSSRAARRSSAVRTPSWLVSILSKRRSAARRARSTYSSRVMSPPRVRAAGAGLFGASVCALAAAGTVRAIRIATRTARMSGTFPGSKHLRL